MLLRRNSFIVVDDEPLVLSVIVDILDDLGYRPDPKHGGKDAVTALESEQSYDLVVTDVIMPDVSGVDVFSAARRRNPRMPVIYVTGFVPDELREFVRADDNAAVISKPFSQEKLARAIGCLLPPAKASFKSAD